MKKIWFLQKRYKIIILHWAACYSHFAYNYPFETETIVLKWLTNATSTLFLWRSFLRNWVLEGKQHVTYEDEIAWQYIKKDHICSQWQIRDAKHKNMKRQQYHKGEWKNEKAIDENPW